MYIVPLTPSPNQSFTCIIPIDSKSITFNFFLRYNTQAECWIMQLSDSKQTIIIDSIPLLCGTNLLAQYSYMKIGSAYIVKVDTTLASDKPDDINLGTNFILVWGDTIS
ncbi:hypothetical protein KTC96_24710 (plasmid) [Clostridium estertheticum]|uniref:phage baseplate plug family protein n=1 Tax=Clostridium estertheticum TaxID=238834 RepID=UPI001C7D4532|nr:hypothetical protein [Clostridium estertheticum]MBX4259730.1 hypothetical protein [Clostridium estertheticum]WLC73317.1 hypothetical protein KTC96_24710 [Clostridium estertheticum]